MREAPVEAKKPAEKAEEKPKAEKPKAKAQVEEAEEEEQEPVVDTVEDFNDIDEALDNLDFDD